MEVCSGGLLLGLGVLELVLELVLDLVLDLVPHGCRGGGLFEVQVELRVQKHHMMLSLTL